MDNFENQPGSRQDGKLIDLIKTNLNTIRPGLDWSRIEFEADTTGNILRLRSSDPLLQAWLQRTVTITRPESNPQVVIYPDIFSKGYTAE